MTVQGITHPHVDFFSISHARKRKDQQDQWFSKAILYRSLVHKTGYKGARQLIRREEKRDGGQGEGRDAGASTILPESSYSPPSPTPRSPSFDLSA